MKADSKGNYKTHLLRGNKATCTGSVPNANQANSGWQWDIYSHREISKGKTSHNTIPFWNASSIVSMVTVLIKMIFCVIPFALSLSDCIVGIAMRHRAESLNFPELWPCAASVQRLRLSLTFILTVTFFSCFWFLLFFKKFPLFPEQPRTFHLSFKLFQLRLAHRFNDWANRVLILSSPFAKDRHFFTSIHAHRHSIHAAVIWMNDLEMSFLAPRQVSLWAASADSLR